MPYENLSEFLDERRNANDLVRIGAEVDPDLELTEIVHRAAADGDGPVVLFENVRGSEFPVVANLLGAEPRMLRAIDADSFDECAHRISGLLQPHLPDGMLEAIRLIPHFSKLTNVPPQVIKTGQCQQVVKMGRDVDLGELPIPRLWPNDPHPAITAGQVTSRDPATELPRTESVTLQVRDRTSLSIHWTPHHVGWSHWQEYRREGRQMPIAIALGGDPLLPYVAAAPLPLHVDPHLFAGFLRGKNVELVKCRSNDLHVPAGAELIIEGYLDAEAASETIAAPGNDMGYESAASESPVIQVTAVTHCANPLFPTIVPGPVSAEYRLINKANERIFQPLVRLFVPEVLDYHAPEFGLGRNFLFVRIRKSYPQQARKVMHALWGLDRLVVAKTIVVVDEDVDIRDEAAVWQRVGTHMHPGRDTLFVDGPIDMADHASPVRGVGTKLGIDATRKTADEGHPRPWPDALQMPNSIVERVSKRWRELGLDEAADS